MNEVYLVTYNMHGEYISSTLYEKKDTAEAVAKEYNEKHEGEKCYATVTSLNVIMG